MNIKILYFLAASLGICGCSVSSSSSVDGGDEASDGTGGGGEETIAITGVVNGVSSSSASLSSLGLKSQITESPMEGDTVTIYSDSGTELGSAITSSDGSYSVDVDESALNPDGEASVTANVILESSNGYSNFAEITLEEGTSTITLDADPDTTLAAEALKKKVKDLGCGGWSGCDLSSLGLDFDPVCFVKLEQKKWELASGDDEGLGQTLGAMKEMIQAQMVAGDFGSYGSPSEMIQAFMSGIVDSTFQTTAASNAASFTGQPADFYTGHIDDALTGIGTMFDVFTSQFAGGAGVGTSGLTKGMVDASDDSLCGEILTDPSALEETCETLLASADFDEFQNTFGSEESIGAFRGLMEQFKGESGSFDFSGWDPRAAMGIMAGSAGNFEEFDPEKMKGFFDNIPTGGEEFDFRDWGRMMADACLDDPTACADAAGITDLAGWGAGQIMGGYVPPDDLDSYDFGSAFSNTGGTIDFSQCVSDPSVCQNLSRPCLTNADCSSGTTCNTTTKLCSGPGTSPIAEPAAGTLNLGGTWRVISSAGGCAPLGTDFTFSGSGNGPYTATVGLATITLNVTGAGSCTFGGGSGACSACAISLQGNGSAGSTFTASSCGLCPAMQLTKQ